MQVIHVATGDSLATSTGVADTLLSRARGLMFRRSMPDDYALVFRYPRQSRQGLHMLFVPFDIDALWLTDGLVQKVQRLSAWTGNDAAVADTVIELPAGAAEDVEPGDRVRIESIE